MPSNIKRSPDKKRTKVQVACVYCKRSHMVCSNERPCSRCVKRGIKHLCTDHEEPKTTPAPPNPTRPHPSFSPQLTPNPLPQPRPPPKQAQSLLAQATAYPQHAPKPADPSLAPSPTAITPVASPWPGMGMLSPRLAGSELDGKGPRAGEALVPVLAAGSGYSDAEWGSLSEFLNTLEFPPSLLPPSSNNSTTCPSPSQPLFPTSFPPSGSQGSFNDLLTQLHKSHQDQHKVNLEALQARVSRPASPNHLFHQAAPPAPGFHPFSVNPAASYPPQPPPTDHPPSQQQQQQQQHHQNPFPAAPSGQLQPVPSIAVGDHLHAILKAKFESSQLVSASEGWDWELGWAKLEGWMDATITPSSKERIQAPLRIFRPTVREILASLSKEEKILIEEGFQRLVLQIDRCFTVIKTPSLFWRRTGQIFKANNEFASLLGMDLNWFKDGKLGIYELMTEDSAVNFWEQYCAIGFDTSRKAVLTTCTLSPPARLLKRNAASASTGGHPTATASSSANPTPPLPTAVRRSTREISCCFSFTVIRDQWGIPLGISGQVMRIA